MTNKPVADKVEKALCSIDGISPAVPQPYFYSKVLAKISSGKAAVWEKWSTIFLRPTVAFATISFIVVVNAIVLYSKFDNEVQTEQAEMALSDEYNQTVTSLYDLENDKP